MRFTGTRTLLFADDLDSIVSFYRQVLGWTVHGEWRDEGVLKWVLVGPPDDPETALMYNRPEGPPVGHISTQQAVPWIYVDDAEAARAEVVDTGGEPGPLESASGGGKEFTITDPQGYRIYISDTR